MIEQLVIENEEQAYDLLKKALDEHNDFDERLQISFDGWPLIELTFDGADFNGGLPSRMLAPIAELQKTLYRIYCRLKYNSDDVRKLTGSEKDALELIITLAPGSTKVLLKLGEIFNEIIKSSNMTGRQVTATIIVAGTLFAASVAWKDWLANKQLAHSAEQTVELSKLETERLKIVTDALTAQPQLNELKEDIENFRAEITRKLKPEDKFFVGGETEPLLDGEEAKNVVPAPREKSVETRIDGEFIITEVKFPRTLDENYVFHVQRLLDGLALKVEASRENLTIDQINILKESGFGIKRVIMAINAKKLRESYTHAKLYSITWPKKD
jgi:hypothetical protein